MTAQVRARRRAESLAAALEVSRERLALAQRAGKIGSFEWNLQTGAVTWSEELEALYGLPAGGFGGTYASWATRVHPDDRLAAEEAVNRAASDGTELQIQFRVIWPNGEVRWIAARAQVIRDASGRPRRMIGINMDVTVLQETATARDRALAAVKETADRLTRLQHATAALSEALTRAEVADVIVHQGLAALGFGSRGASGVAVGLVSDDRISVHVLRAAGYPPDVVEAWRHFPVDTPLPFTEPVRSEAPIWLESSAEAVARYPLVAPLLGRTGNQALVALPLRAYGRTIGVIGLSFATARTFSESDRTFVLALAQQCAQALERARLYEAERTARAEAEAAIRVRDELFSVAAHELKTPITSLRGFAQLELRRWQRAEAFDPQRVHHALETILRQADKLTRLVLELLDIARLETGTLTLEPFETDLVHLVRSVVEGRQEETTRHPIVIRAPAPAVATVDPLRIEQVVTNLIDNAIKYSPTGSEIAIDVTTPEPRTVRLAVRDHGIGVAPEHRERIFERLYQARGQRIAGQPEQADAWAAPGLGLGLYISRQIVELHGGTIALEAPPDGGAQFIVVLPKHGKTSGAGNEPPPKATSSLQLE